MARDYGFGYADTPTDLKKFYTAYADLTIMAAHNNIRIVCIDDMRLEKDAVTPGKGVKADPIVIKIAADMDAKIRASQKDVGAAATFDDACAIAFDNQKRAMEIGQNYFKSLSADEQKAFAAFEKNKMEAFKRARDDNRYRINVNANDAYFFGIFHADEKNDKSISVLLGTKRGIKVATYAVTPQFESQLAPPSSTGFGK